MHQIIILKRIIKKHITGTYQDALLTPERRPPDATKRVENRDNLILESTAFARPENKHRER